jgi:polar amino acid transport system substrate-binding protein
MRSRLLILIAALTLGLTALAAVGCGDDDDDGSGDTSGADVGTLTEGTLFVGLDTPYPPFADGQPPNATGYDVDVLNAIGEEMGLTVEFQDTGFQTIFRDVAAGQFDTAGAASTIKPGREKVVDFTDPYYSSSSALLVPEGSDIASVDDLSGAIVGAQDGTVEEEFLNEKTDAGEVRGFPEGTTAISALLTGQTDAAMMDEAVAADAIEKEGGMQIVETIPGEDLFGFAVAPDNDTLREAMNDALATIKDDGTMDELYEKYFGSKPPSEVLEGTNTLLTDD